MNTKVNILELIRELGEATVLATQLVKNIDYLGTLGFDITKVPQLDDLTRKAADLRCEIDKTNFDIIANAPKY